jgi:Ankyrin repeats (3 copies)/Ankyrin repeat
MKPIAIEALSWLVFSVGTLNLTELACASSIDPSIIDYTVSPISEDKTIGDPEDFIELLSGLVSTFKNAAIGDDNNEETEEDRALREKWDSSDSDDSDENSDGDTTEKIEDTTYIKLCHFSVREYLTSTQLQNSKKSEFFLDKDEANISLTRSCLACIIYANNASSAEEDNSEPEESEINLPILGYAVKNWGKHYDAIARVPRDLEALALKTLSPDSGILSHSITELEDDDSEVSEENLDSGMIASNPLFFTVAVESLRLTELVLSQSTTQINIIAGSSGTALHTAARTGNLQIVRVLLDKGADVHLSCGKNGTALDCAAAGGYLEVVKLLLDHGSDAGANNEESGTPLHHAAKSSINGPEIVSLLLAKGADVNAQGGEYATPLQAAAYSRNTDLVQLFLNKGADVNASGGKYGNALQAAAALDADDDDDDDDGLKVIEVLLQSKVDINISGGPYGRALYAAVATAVTSGRDWRQDPLVEYLLEHGATVHDPGSEWEEILVGIGEYVKKCYSAADEDDANGLAETTIEILRDLQRYYKGR